MYQLDPCSDVRWHRFVDRHPAGSVFHTPGWLEALRRTYGYEPVVYTTAPPGKEVVSGQVFCRVNSWLTGRRLVSVPFSDHTALLWGNRDDSASLISYLLNKVDEENYRYVEIRPVGKEFAHPMLWQSDEFYWHKVPLDREISVLFRSFHKSCVQRKIRRAVREKLEYIEGRSERLIRQFHRLLIPTHHRHHLPPQPISWFRNLVDCLGENIRVRIASKDGRPIAGMISLSYKESIIYKYGCSDARYHNLGGMAFLFWKTIQEAKACGLKQFDMGRSDLDNHGLVAFKEHWGAKRSTLTYWKYGCSNSKLKVAKQVFAFAPAFTLPVMGRLLYRHGG